MNPPEDALPVQDAGEQQEFDFEAQMEGFYDGDLAPTCDLENPESCESCQ